jgi:hypothetical protein
LRISIKFFSFSHDSKKKLANDFNEDFMMFRSCFKEVGNCKDLERDLNEWVKDFRVFVLSRSVSRRDLLDSTRRFKVLVFKTIFGPSEFCRFGLRNSDFCKAVIIVLWKFE